MLKIWRSPRARLVAAGLCLVAGLYVGDLVAVAPHHFSFGGDGQLKPGAPLPAQQVVIPRLGVRAGIVPNRLSALDQGFVVQRTQSGGDPRHGGNFVLVGHRYVFHMLPWQVARASVFHDLPSLRPGDGITVYWQHQRYAYKVSRVYQVRPSQTAVEAPTKEAKLTLYTCTLEGQADGRVVVEARPL